MKTAFLLPTLNEEKQLKKLLSNLKKIGKTLVVDNNSQDKTREIAKKFADYYIFNSKNKGYSYSIKKGLKYLLDKKFQIVITFDADGQHNYRDAIVLKNKMDSYDLIIGNRSFYNRKIEKTISKISYKYFKVKDPLTGMKCYNLEKLNHKIRDLNLNERDYGLFFLKWIGEIKFRNIKILVNKKVKKSSMGERSDVEEKFYKVFCKFLKEFKIKN
tara:strand:+ start:1259 stop:1903 length:645 start_codon:yes stop_codon:yes gene_type:complete